MIYAICHFTKTELNFLCNVVTLWRQNECPIESPEAELQSPQSTEVARELAFDLVERMRDYVDALRRNNEREQREAASDTSF